MDQRQQSPLKVLVTAGPTLEPIDAVRYIANRSSGRMGMAIAQAAAARGTPCTLLLGPTPLDSPVHSQIRVIRFQTTADLESLLKEHWPDHDVLIMAAAVADFRPAGVRQDQKMKRSAGMTLELEATPDLLQGIRPMTRPSQTVVGFALEPENRLISSAKEKLVNKMLDMIVANPLETMDSHAIQATVMFSEDIMRTMSKSVVNLNSSSHSSTESTIALSPTSKDLFATWLVEQTLRVASAKSRN